MITKIPLENILFLDIETVSLHEDFSALDSEMQQLWEQKTQYQRKDDFSPEAFYDRAGIWAEFGKVVCISAGYFVQRNDVRQFRVTSFFGEEPALLRDFSNHVNEYWNRAPHVFCGHNIKEFDIPFLARRMVVHGVALPEKLSLFGKKPWEVPHLDTLELWKFGDFKNFTSLKLLTKVLGIPSSKDDIDGKDVGRVFYEEKDLDRIITYCEKDVIAVAQVVLKFRREPLLVADEILHV